MDKKAPVKFERRRHARYAITGKVAAKLIHDGKEDLTYFMVDISKFGIGLLVDKKLDRGTILQFEIHDRKDEPILLKVMWVIASQQESPYAGLGLDDEEDRDVFRIGLWVVDEIVDIEELLRNYDSIYLETL